MNLLNLKGRSFLKLLDFTSAELEYLIDLAENLKKLKYAGIRPQNLKGKNIALIFEKPSTRTRCSFVVAANDEGAYPEYLGKDDIQLGKKESVKDTARVLGRLFDGIEFRGFSHETVEELAKYSGIPVWNGLTDKFHPTQILADFLTIREHKGYLKGIKFAYLGDGRNNMANSLMIGAAKFGMDFRIAAPKSLFPEEELIKEAESIAEENNASLLFTESIDEAVNDADVIYTDVWVSMGEEDMYEDRINLLKDYQVNSEVMAKADEEAIFMHCLPAFHDLGTDVMKDIKEKYGMEELEVTDEVFEGEQSVVFDEAENRMHTIKAIMVATLGNQ
ncbi:MAG: ornithine carbamoyltransferase [Andreesenia angusta]|nr:ornithine carbamoyltransferase [Andreesenia angusta]